MTLNHDIYEEAMENVKLSDETGMRLIEEARNRRKVHRQKSRVQVAAVLAVIITAAVSFNGFCYAQTGQNVWEMFTSHWELFNKENMTELVAGVKESGEFVIHNNKKFTLERYWYDKENVELFYTIRIDSMDGTSLDKYELRDYTIYTNSDSYRAESSTQEINEDGSSILQNWRGGSVYDKDGKPFNEIKLYLRYYGEEEEPILKTFLLEPTGELEVRYADLSFMKGCSEKARINGGGIKIYFDEDWKEGQPPFEWLDVMMKDGTIYRGGTDDKVFPRYNVKGELLNADELGLDSEDIKKCEHDWVRAASDQKEWLVFYIKFDDFINVDEIEAVYVDNVRVPIE